MLPSTDYSNLRAFGITCDLKKKKKKRWKDAAEPSGEIWMGLSEVHLDTEISRFSSHLTVTIPSSPCPDKSALTLFTEDARKGLSLTAYLTLSA